MKKIFILIIAFFCIIASYSQQNLIIVHDGKLVSYGGKAITYQNYNPLAKIVFSRMSPAPSDSLKYAINQLVDTIEYYGVWDKADIYRGYASNSEASANINWKSTSFTASPQLTPTFTVNEGYTGDGSAYIKESYNPATDADSFQLDDATVHLYNNSNELNTNDMILGITATDWIEIFQTASEFRYRLNSTGTFSNLHRNNLQGGITLTRNVSSYIQTARNDGVYTTSATINSTAIPNQADGIYTLAWNNAGTPTVPDLNTISFIYIGASLTILQSQKLYEAEKRFLDYFNKTPEIDTVQYVIDDDGGGDYTSISAALAAITDNSYWKQYELYVTNDTLSEYDLTWKDWVHLIGNDTSTAKVIGYLPASTAQATIQSTSAIDANYVNCTFRNIHISMQNGRYAIHSDATAIGAGSGAQRSQGATQNFINCKIVHEGNAEADAYWSTEVWASPDAFGMGQSFNMTVNIDSCYTESKGTNATQSRGIAMHAATSATYKSILNISNTICRSATTNALRIGVLYNNADEYYFDNVQMYGALLIDGSGTYTDNTTETGTDPILLNGNIIAD